MEERRNWCEVLMFSILRLSVGTQKSLLIVDVHTNKLVEVIGSENKLLGECIIILRIY